MLILNPNQSSQPIFSILKPHLRRNTLQWRIEGPVDPAMRWGATLGDVKSMFECGTTLKLNQSTSKIAGFALETHIFLPLYPLK